MNHKTAQLTLLRHGESIWNQQNRFTGWVDVSLSRVGMQEASKAGKLLTEQRYDVAFTSSLLRAQDTLYEVLKQNSHCDQYMRIHESASQWYEHFVAAKDDLNELKIYISDKLNERYYGDLQGATRNSPVVSLVQNRCISGGVVIISGTAKFPASRLRSWNERLWHGATSLSTEHNAEAGNLAKPLQGWLGSHSFWHGALTPLL
jgi:hypothetical protein